MTLAKYGKYSLCRKTNIFEEKTKSYTTHDLCIDYEYKDNAKISIAYFTEGGDVVSYDNRLFEHMNTVEDLENVFALTKIAKLIYEGEAVQIES